MSTTSNPLRYLTSLCFISLFAITAWSSGQPTLSPTEILEKTLAALRGVHTATYNVTKHIYPTPLDSFFIKENKFRYIECENPADTSGLAQHIVFYTDGSLYNSYDGKRRIYGRGNYLDATDLSRWFGVRTFEPPFFNNVTRLCEYLLKPSDIKQVTVEDCGDTWLEALPELHQPGLLHCRQSLHGGQLVHPAPVVGHHCRHPGLLEHNL